MTIFEITTNAGADRIAWARQSMPVLAEVQTMLAESGELAGLRIALNLVLEPKTANLALALQSCGAEVAVSCDAASTDGTILPELRRRGVAVFADPQADTAADAEFADEILQWGPDVIVDDGATLVRHAHSKRPDLIARMRGATEETTSGVRPLRAMHADGALKLPVIGVNDLTTKYLFDNVYGTGQSCVMTFLDVTNLQLSGKIVVVVGYGWVGRGVAQHARAMGARVTVVELDPVKALQAVYDGHLARALSDATDADVIFAATGLAGAVTMDHLKQFTQDVYLVTAGGGAFELPMVELEELGRVDVRPGVAQYTLPNGTNVLVLSEGDCVNCVDGEGNPIEVMDLSLSLQALAVRRIAREGRDLEPGVYGLGDASEDEVARIRLRHEGASLEPMTEAIALAQKNW